MAAGDVLDVPLQAYGLAATDATHADDRDVVYSTPVIAHSRLALFLRWPTYTRLDLLVESAWPTVDSVRFGAFKVLAAVWTTAIWIWTITLFGQKYAIYLTNWNFTALMLYFNLSAYLCVRHHLGRRTITSQADMDQITTKTEDIELALSSGSASDDAAALERRASSRSEYAAHPSVVRTVYFLAQHVFAWTCLVVLVYWSTEFPSYVKKSHSSSSIFSNICLHALSFVLILLDLTLGRIEMVPPHALYMMTLSVIYLIFNGIYCAVHGGYIYYVLQWNGFLTVLAIAGCAAVLLGAFPLGHLLCRWRNNRSGNVPPEAEFRVFT